MLFQTKQSQSAHYFQMFRLWYTLYRIVSGNEKAISTKRATNLQTQSRPNQSLKLTELAVDDFAARCWTDLAHLIGTSAQQATWRRLFAAAA